MNDIIGALDFLCESQQVLQRFVADCEDKKSSVYAVQVVLANALSEYPSEIINTSSSPFLLSLPLRLICYIDNGCL